MTPDAKLLAARARADAARAKLFASVDHAKQRLSPGTVASDAVSTVRAKASDLAGDGVDAVRERPMIAVAAASALGLLLARRPIAQTLARWTGGGDATGTKDAS